MEEIVEFKNKLGQTLSGIIHSPDKNMLKKNVGIVMLQAGLKDRVGAHRLYVKLARQLCVEGYYVLRFDSHGIGDSEGELSGGYSIDNFVLIEKGLFVDDAISSVDFLRKRIEVKKIVFLGLCGGAITGLIAAANDKRICDLILLDPTIVLDNPSNALTTNIHPFNANIYLRAYINKLINPRKLFRLITFRSNYLELWQVVFVNIKHRFIKDMHFLKVREENRFNNYFLDAFKLCVRYNKRILFILADDNENAWDFKRLFQDKYLKNESTLLCCNTTKVKSANHEFASLEAQRILYDKISVWLNGKILDN